MPLKLEKEQARWLTTFPTRLSQSLKEELAKTVRFKCDVPSDSALNQGSGITASQLKELRKQFPDGLVVSIPAKTANSDVLRPAAVSEAFQALLLNDQPEATD